MFYFLSKFLPPFIYPLGLACLLLGLALWVRRRSNWQTRLTAIALALLWVGGNRIVTLTLIRSLEWQFTPSTAFKSDVPRADVIVVLGGATRPQAFPRQTSELNEAGDRLLCAAMLYQQGAAPYILLSGGTTPWVGSASIPGAERMADILMRIGIPREALWLETNSRNTYENRVETQALLQDRGVTKVILVTSAMHMPRSFRVFAKTGFEIIPVPTDYLVTQQDWEYYTQPNIGVQLVNLLPSAENLNLTTRVLKEYVGIAIYGLRGWL